MSDSPALWREEGCYWSQAEKRSTGRQPLASYSITAFMDGLPYQGSGTSIWAILLMLIKITVITAVPSSTITDGIYLLDLQLPPFFPLSSREEVKPSFRICSGNMSLASEKHCSLHWVTIAILIVLLHLLKNISFITVQLKLEVFFFFKVILNSFFFPFNLFIKAFKEERDTDGVNSALDFCRLLSSRKEGIKKCLRLKSNYKRNGKKVCQKLSKMC